MRAPLVLGQHRPYVQVQLTMGGVTQDVWMLLDTGADTTTIPPDLATALTGIEFDLLGDPGPDINGVGSSPTASRVADAELEYSTRRFALKLWVAPVPAPVLGRNDFMRRFDCRFYWSRNPPEFFVEPAPAPRPRKQAPSAHVVHDPTIRRKR